MHELGIVFHVIKNVEEVGKENNVNSIAKVVLEVGEVSGIIHDYIIDCWDWAVKKHEIMTECKLVIEEIPAVTFCENCENTYPTVAHGKTCPHCGSGETYLLTGNEINIKEIEVC